MIKWNVFTYLYIFFFKLRKMLVLTIYQCLFPLSLSWNRDGGKLQYWDQDKSVFQNDFTLVRWLSESIIDICSFEVDRQVDEDIKLIHVCFIIRYLHGEKGLIVNATNDLITILCSKISVWIYCKVIISTDAIDYLIPLTE